MSLCKLPSTDPDKSVLVDPEAVSFIVPALEAGNNKVSIYERGVPDVRFRISGMTATRIAELLEAHEAKRAGAPGEPFSYVECARLVADVKHFADRNAILVAGLRTLADGGAFVLPTWWEFAQHVLRDAGVADAEPETPPPPTSGLRVGDADECQDRA